MLTVPLAPEFLSVGRATRLEALRARRLDLGNASVGWAHHKNGRWREPHGALRNGSKKEAPSAATPMRADDDKVGFDIGGELSNGLRCVVRSKMRRQPLERVLGGCVALVVAVKRTLPPGPQ